MEAHSTQRVYRCCGKPSSESALTTVLASCIVNTIAAHLLLDSLPLNICLLLLTISPAQTPVTISYCDGLQVKVRQLLDDVEYQVVARGANAHAADDAEILRDYFNLKACLRVLSKDWSERDQRYKSLRQYFPGMCLLPHRNLCIVPSIGTACLFALVVLHHVSL